MSDNGKGESTFHLSGRLAIDMTIDCLPDALKRCIKRTFEISESACCNAVNRYVHPRPLCRQAHPLQPHIKAVGLSVDAGRHLESAINVIAFVDHGFPLSVLEKS